jgi:hypothetical protein
MARACQQQQGKANNGKIMEITTWQHKPLPRPSCHAPLDMLWPRPVEGQHMARALLQQYHARQEYVKYKATA